jgi:hypothetical protein
MVVRLCATRHETPAGGVPPVRAMSTAADDGPGPLIADGVLYINSGYDQRGRMSCNVLLAFSLDGK